MKNFKPFYQVIGTFLISTFAFWGVNNFIEGVKPSVDYLSEIEFSAISSNEIANDIRDLFTEKSLATCQEANAIDDRIHSLKKQLLEKAAAYSVQDQSQYNLGWLSEFYASNEMESSDSEHFASFMMDPCSNPFASISADYTNISECGNNATFSFAATVNSNTDILVSFEVPTDFAFEGNVAGGALVTNGAIVEIMPDIDAGEIAFTFEFRALCGASDDEVFNFSFDYLDSDSEEQTCTFTSLPLVVLNIAVTIPPEGTPGRNTENTVVSVLNENDTLISTVVQEGVGVIDSLFFYVDDHSLMSIEKVMLCETEVELNLATKVGDRNYFWIDAAALGGDGFTTNEGVDVCVIWKTVMCPSGDIPPVVTGATTSCTLDPETDICQNTEYNAAMDFGAKFPEIIQYIDETLAYDPTCIDGSPIKQRWILKNEGTAPAGSINVRLTEFGGNTPIDFTSISYTVNGGSVLTDATITNTVRGFPACVSSYANSADLAKRMNITFDNILLKPNEELVFEYDVYPVPCGCGGCSVPRRLGTDISDFEVKDLCETVTQNALIRQDVAWPNFDVDISSFMETPVTNCAGSISTMNVTVTQYLNSYLNNEGFNAQDDDERNAVYIPCMDCYFSATFDLPNGLDYIPGTIEWIDNDGTVWTPDTEVYTDNDGGVDQLIVTWLGQEPSGFDVFNEASGIFFDFTPDCENELAKGPGCSPVLYDDVIDKTFSWSNGACPGCTEETVECAEDINLTIKCPGIMTDCICDGFVHTNTEARRQNLYISDPDNDGLPDAGSAYNQSLLRTDRFLKGDSIRVDMGGYVSANDAFTSFDYIYAEVDFPDNQFIPLGGEMTIIAGGITYTCDVLTQQIIGNKLVTDLSIPSLMANGCTMPTSYFHTDSVALTFYYTPTDQFSGETQQLTQTTRIFASDQPYGGPEYSCRLPLDYRLTQVGTQNSFDYFNQRLNGFSGCAAGSPYYRGYSRIGSANVDFFPGEYINDIEFITHFESNIPAGMVFDEMRIYIRRKNASGTNNLGSVVHGGQYPNGGIYVDATDPSVTIVGNQLFFDFATFLSAQGINGGDYPASDEGYSWSILPYFIATCDLSVGPVEDATMHATHIKNENIFCESGSEFEDTLTNLNYDGGAEIVVTAVDDCIDVDDFPTCARIRVQNTAPAVANNAWLSFYSGSGAFSFASLTRITGGASDVITGSQYNMFQLGDLSGNANELYELCVYANACGEDSLTVASGFDCVTAPSIVEEATCKSEATITYKPVRGSLGMAIKAPAIDEVLGDLCDTVTYVLNFVAAGPGFLSDLYTDLNLPLDTEFVPGSFEMAYPADPSLTVIPPDADFGPIGDPSYLNGNTYRLDISGSNPILSTIGLIGSAGSAFNDNVVNIRFDIMTKCGFASGSRLFFEANAKEGCGEDLEPIQKDFSKLIAISDAPEPFVSEIGIEADTLNACAAEQTPITINYAINGNMTTSVDDSIRVILPAGLTFVPGSYIQGGNPTPDPPVVVNESGLNVAYWGIGGIDPGTDTNFGFSIQANDIGQECKDYLLTVQTFKSGIAYCDSTDEDCVVRSISDESQANIFIDKADLAITSASAVAMAMGDNEMITFTMEVENQGNLPTGSDAELIVDIYKDTNQDGRVNDGDQLIDFLTFDVNLAVGQSVIYTDDITMMAGMSCDLLAYIDISKNCSCKSAGSFSIEAKLDLKLPDDVYVCSNEAFQIGPISTSYTYDWISLDGSDLSALSPNLTTSPAIFQFDNNTGSTISWDYGLRITRGSSCYTFDTITVHIYPETFAEVSNTVCGPVADCGDPAYGFPLAGPSGGTNYNWDVTSGDMTAVIDDLMDPQSTVSSVITEPTTFTLSYDDENGCPAEFIQNISLLNCACTALGDTVWFDLNVDGIQDLTEMGIPGVTVYLYNATNLSTPIQSTMTDMNGHYLFAPLAAGNYVVSFDKTTHTSTYHILEPTMQDIGLDEDDSDADPNTGFTGAYFVPNGISNLTVDAGFYPGFDLALSKEINTTLSPGPYLPGDIVSFDITVTNQGGYYEAQNVDVVDYIPTGLSYSGGTSGIISSLNSNVTTITNNGGGAFTIDKIAPLDAVTLTVEMQITATALGSSIVNYAEISDFENEYDLPDSDSTPDVNDSNDAGGNPNSSEDNHIDDDGMDTDGDGITDEDDHDPAQLDLPIVDIALIKTYDALYQPLPVPYGTLVKFDITVYNQGDFPLHDIVVQDYAPTGLNFNSSTPQNISEGWTPGGTINIPGPLAPGANTTVSIYMTVLESPTSDYINAAEIISADDENGRDVAGFDIDSNPGSNTADENSVTPGSGGDNNFTSTGIGELGSEDDHDIAIVEVVFPVLSMTKEHVSLTMTSLNCYDVVYEITVRNDGGYQGVYDLIDDPMYDDDFVINSAIFTTNAFGNPGGSLPPGSSTYVLGNDQVIGPLGVDIYEITINVCLDLEDASSAGDETYTSSCYDSNGGTDSSPGEGLHNTASLDTNNDGVVDLEDETCVDVPYFTLDKEVASVTAVGDGTYNVVYTITVSNIGGASGDYNLSDTPGYDNDITLNSASFNSDTGLSDPSLSTTVPVGGWILASDQVLGVNEVDVFTVTTNVGFDFSDVINGDDSYSACGNGNGSDPEAGQGLYNEAGLDVNDDGVDDIMAETCEDLEVFDLALTKKLSPLQTIPVTIGSTVTYEIEVCNQGTVDAYDIQVVDYLPAGMMMSDPNWLPGPDAGEYFRTISGPITPGDCKMLSLITTVTSVPGSGMITNYSEISQAKDEDGNIQDDVDSTPDDNPLNDGDVTDNNTANEDDDEDDHDPATIPVVMVNCAISSNSVVCPDAALMMEEIGSGNTMWSWSGPNSFAASTKAVSINPPVAGIYKVTVTQADGLTSTCEATIQVSPVITLSAITVDVKCKDGDDGQINLSVSGGAAPLSFDWSNDGPESPDTDPQSISGLSAGSYTVTVTDANDCSTTASYNVTEPMNGLSCSTSGSDISCKDGNDGTISVVASGGTVPYQYSLNGGAYQPGTVFNNVVAGTHNVTIKDANDCEVMCTINLSEPIELSCSINATNDNSCIADNGLLEVLVTGGTMPYEFSDDGGTTFQSTGIFTGLDAGSYTMTVKDAKGCMSTCVAVLTSPSLPFCTIIASTNISCNEGNDGSITADGSLGSGTYEYSIDGTTWQSGGTFNGLTAGTYMVTVRNQDSPTCRSVCSVTLTESAALSCMLTGTDVSCNGLSDGTISVTATGGNGDYTFSIDGGSTWQLSNIFSGLSAGTHTIILRDNDDDFCVTSCDIILLQPGSLTCNATGTNLLCNGDNTGTITVMAMGGVTPYEYSLSGTSYQPGNVFTSLDAGNYELTVRDNNGCLTTCMVALTEPSILSCTNTHTNVSNCDVNDGTVTVAALGGTTPFEYSIDGGAYQMSNSFNGLMAGTHSITVRDANGCTSNCSATLTAPITPMCTISSFTHVACYGEATGSITVTGSGGTAPYEFSIDNSTWQSSGTFNGLSAGTHSVYIRNATSMMCTSMCTFIITEPEDLTCSILNTDVSCKSGSDGSAVVAPVGGVAPYAYLWNDSNGQTGSTAIGLSVGSYEVTVTDDNNCSTTCSIMILEPEQLSCTLMSTSLNCNGDTDASITVSGNGGVGTYNYSLDGGPYQPGNTFSSLGTGTYAITIKDENECTSSCSITINEPALLTCSLTKTDVTDCAVTNGTITVTGTGGIAPYMYTLNGGTPQSSNTFSNLGVGSYVVKVIDSQGCENICEITVSAPAAPTCEISFISNVSCSKGADGSVTVEGSDGSGNYQYSINSGTFQTNNVFTNLSAGDYTVTIRNMENVMCTSTCFATITEPEPLVCMTMTGNVSCDSGADGLASVSAQGGTEPYYYLWSNGFTGNTATGLAAGSYTVNVTDQNNCVTSCTVMISEPINLSFTTSVVPVACNGENSGSITITPSGATPPYEYSLNGQAWQPGNIYAGLTAGPYVISVRDNNGCVISDIEIVTEPLELMCSLESTDATNCDVQDGTVTVSGTGGVLPYEYSIDAGVYQSSNAFAGLMAGTHLISIKDANGCTSTCETVINAPNTPMCQLVSITQVECFGESTGAVIATGTGGNSPYEFSIDNLTWQTSGAFSNLEAGMHAIYIRNNTSPACVSMCGVEIVQPEELQCLLTPNDPLCNGGSDGNITVVATEGTPGYEYSVNGSPWQPGHVFSNLSAGNYTVTIRDDNGCTKTCETILGQPPALTCSTIVVDLLCNGDASGTLTITGNGGVSPYDYNLDGGFWQDNNIFSGLTGGSYVVTIRDENDCTSTCNAIINEPTALACNLVELMPESCAFNDGSIEVNATGGTAPVTYSIDGGATTQATGLFTGLTLGTYTITITDANGCIETCDFEILPDCFDLALTKQLVTPSPYSYGQYVVFDINVINQGNIDATDVEVTDHLPCGFSYDPGRLMNLSNNWTLYPTSFPMTTISSIPAQSMVTVQIEVKIEMCTTANGHVNVAEISEAFDGDGNPGDDVDSNPDYDPNNDNGGDPNGSSNDQEDGNGTDDEDDHDPEFVPVYDVALEKEMVTQPTYSYGQLVKFSIKVCNQSSPVVTNVAVVDHIPAGYSYSSADNPGWVGVGAPTPADVNYTIPGPIAGGACVAVPIFLTLEMAGGYDDWKNVAEVTGIEDEFGDPVDDVDSDEDNDDGDQSEDDEDGAGPEVVDAALVKTTSATGPFRYGDMLTYDFEISNQGNVDLYNVLLNDFIPCGFSYLGTNSPLWVFDSGTSIATTTIAGPITPGTSMTVSIELQVQACTSDPMGAWTNVAELESFQDEDGEDITDEDIDSDGDNDPANDDTEDNINDNSNGDEDDNDPETIEIYDLAQIKTLVTEGPYTYGQLLEYEICVVNQGNVTANMFTITDHLPGGLGFDVNNNTGWDTTNAPAYDYVVSSPLVSADTICIPMYVTFEMTTGGTDNYMNIAEISEDDGEDADSTSDDDPNNDGDPDNDSFEDGEDDHDPENFEVVDAALAKTTTAAGPFSYGDQITFDINVYNQGNIDLYNIKVNDFVPCGFEYLAVNDGTWSWDGTSIATTTIPGVLAAGSNISIPITLEFKSCYELASWKNTAEIESFENEDGEDITDEDVDSDGDDDPSNDGDMDNNSTGNENGDEDDSDFEEPEVFDLAQIKKIVTPMPYAYGDIIEYSICVVNQGNVTAQNITISDHLPEGLGFDPALNPGWDATNAPRYDYLIAGPLMHGDTICIPAFMSIDMTMGGGNDHRNISEISYAEDENGDPGEDADSDPDTDPNNDGTIDDNSYEDGEDDHDIADLMVVDAALSKTTTATGPFRYGDQITFDINVFNQGNIDLYNIKVNDFVPCGFEYLAVNDGTWSWDGTSIATTTIPGVLAAGSNISIPITLEFKACYELASWKNTAEIESFENEDGEDITDEDVDSDGDDDPSNDGDMDDNSTGNENGDEDDSDFEEPEVFDLAQIKKIVTPMPYAYGDIIEYSICVVNQGNVTAQNITISDHLPEGLGFDPALNLGWDATNTPRYDYLIAGPLMHGDTICIPAFMSIDMTMGGGNDHRNISEISNAEDENGDQREDADSDPDTDPNNDGNIADDSYEDGEDDHDIADLMVVDAALSKTTTATGPFRYGDQITFDINVFNQGNIDLYNIKVNDFVPCGFEYLAINDGTWSWDGTSIATTTIPGVLAAGDNITIPISLKIKECVDSGAWRNIAEIESFQNEDGEDITDEDVDSDGDDDPTNDSTMDDNSTDNSNGDEDDSDFEEPEVFDLAQDKTKVTAGPHSYGDLIEYSICVENQGNVTAQNIIVTDYLPAGLSFNQATNPNWDGAVATAPTYTFTSLVEPLETVCAKIFVTMEETVGGANNYTNTTEITGSEDENGDPREDADSTEDDDPDNDPEGEDDHDTESFETVDAALAKTTTATGPFSYGAQITFDITVYNQGNVDLYNIKVNDFIPCGFSYLAVNDNTWNYDGTSMATTTIAGVLAAGANVTVPITLELQECSESGAWRNTAEIESFEDENGEDVTGSDQDSDGDDDPTNDGSMEDNATDGENGDEDDSDFEELEIFDLALIKTTVTETPYGLGEDITFELTVVNQGNVSATNITINEYLPAGFQFSAADNPGWSSVDAPTYDYLITDVLMMGDTIRVPFTAELIYAAGGLTSYTNGAEIGGAEDESGMDRSDDDADSDPDSDPDNDGDNTDVNDNSFDDSDSGGEDDYDEELIEVVDIALVKTVITPGPYVYGQQVTFAIEVFNQGVLDLHNIIVNDFLPCGYKWQTTGNTGWAYDAGTSIAQMTIAGPIVGQTSQVVNITLEVQPCSQPGAYTNVAEIESMEDVNGNDITGDDVDSTADDDPTNDTEMDNVNDNTDGDEDDADPASIDIFDLALIKELITPPMYEEGDVLEYKITVVNQGNISATNVQVWDHLPAGILSDASQNTAWDATLSPSFSQTITSVIQPGESVSVSFFGIINYVGRNQQDYVNYAEIGGATDEDGNPQEDADSTPDNDPNNDGTPVDDQLTDKGDEDDHDPEFFLFNSEFIPPCDAPCDMNCISQLNLSLRETDCAAEVLPNMVIPDIDEACNDPSYYSIRLIDEHGNVLPDSTVALDLLGQNITYEVYNNTPGCGNMCWGNILVEYKFKPQIACPVDMTLSCGALDVLPLPDVSGGGACSTESFEIYLAEEVRDKVECGDPGAEDYTHVVKRTYIATDALGNTASCKHTIMLERIDLSGLEFPPNASVNCSELDNFILADSGVPLPWLTGGLTGLGIAGVPVICHPDLVTTTGLVCPSTGSGTGIPLIPQVGATILGPDGPELIAGDVVGNCSAAITYTDVMVPQIGCTKKVIRTWEIREWYCGEELPIGPHNQLIEIKDDMAPVVECPVPFVVTTNDDCAGDIALPAAITSDGCDNGTNVTIEHPWGIVDGNGGTATLEVGTHIVTYKVSDNCYNSSSCTTTVTIRDNTEPVAICEQYTVVSISQDGNTFVSSDVFDDGSWDECGDVKTCAMKMEDVLRFRSLSVDRVYMGIDYVLRSRMDNGCLQDYVTGVTLDGEDYVTEDDLCIPYVRFCCSDVGTDQMVIFRASDHGGNYSDCMVTVEVQDKSIPTLECPSDVTIDCRVPYALDNLSLQFGGPIVVDNCSDLQPLSETTDADVNQCGIGTIVRLFEVKDGFGTVVRSCKQHIEINNQTPFGGDIEWPLDFESTCGTASQLVPEVLTGLYAYPTFPSGDDQCSLLGFDYEDQFFAGDPTTGECGVIRRSWTVIDWCSTVNGEFVTYPLTGPYIQTIKIENDVAPVIDAQADVVFTSASVDCVSTDIQVWREATDDCTPEGSIDWSYSISDADGNLVTTDVNGVALSGADRDIKGTFGSGSYSILWTACDGCGNCSTSTQSLEVVNTKTPIPVCMNGLSITLDDNGNAELWASDVDAGSYHPCGNDFTLGFNALTDEQVLYFNCTHLGEQFVDMYVRDTRSGVSDYCTARIVLTDPLTACVPGNLLVAGEVYTEELHYVEDVKVELGANMPFEMTDEVGEYAFVGMPMGGDYMVAPEKDVEYLNGVSTLDLILIQRHILGIELLTSPYKLIAADVNSSSDINGIDLVELRKLILGIYTELPANKSWRFVDVGYKFENEENPWEEAVPENYEIANLANDMDIDFIGVKIGDVNGSAITSSADISVEERSNRWPLVLEVEEQSVKQGEVFTMKVYGRNYERISGWQTTLNFDKQSIEILEVNGKSASIEGGNHNITRQEEGWMTMSYHSLETESKSADEVLFELVIRAKQNINTAELLELSSAVTAREAYRGYNEIVDIRMDVRKDEQTKIVSVNPNPWITSTEIAFHMPQAGEGKWVFFDVNGRVLYSKTEIYEQGQQLMRLNRSDIDGTGIIYMKLTTDNGVAEHKMIVVK